MFPEGFPVIHTSVCFIDVKTLKDLNNDKVSTHSNVRMKSDMVPPMDEELHINVC